MIKIIELFAGVGSQTQALKNLEMPHDVVGISEIDKYAIKSYEAIHGKVHNFGDITKIDKLPYADLWTYSFPCQDLSVAGKQAGIKEGTRSGLLLEVERLLKVSERPKFLLLENVKNLVGKQHKADFDRWLDKLDEFGYKSFWKVLNSKDYGIPQNRERVFVISIRKDLGQDYIFAEKQELKIRLKDMLENEVDEKYYLKGSYLEWWEKNKEKQIKKKYSSLDNDIAICQTARQYASWNGNYIQCLGMLDIKGNEQVRRVYDENGISPTLNTMQGGNRQPKVLSDYKIRRLTPKECWRLMGFRDEQFEKAKQVNSDSQLYKQAGNSIVINVLEEIFRRLF